MNDLRKAAEMALEQLESHDYWADEEAIQALRQALNETPPCKTDPRAPHGFDRDASHSADRYVCECESWESPEETFILDRGCYERGCVAYDERDGDGVYMSEERVHKTDKSIHEWVGLTDEERFGEHTKYLTRNEWALLIEAKLKEKNS